MGWAGQRPTLELDLASSNCLSALLDGQKRSIQIQALMAVWVTAQEERADRGIAVKCYLKVAIPSDLDPILGPRHLVVRPVCRDLPRLPVATCVPDRRAP